MKNSVIGADSVVTSLMRQVAGMFFITLDKRGF